MKRTFELITTFIYLFAASALTVMALSIMGWSIYEVVQHIINKESLKKGEVILVMLQSVGAIVIAVAIIDVAKYMIEEEVIRSKELRSVKEARQTVTKIMVILSIAVGIEGLVYLFQAGLEDIQLLIYPAILLLVSVVILVGLGYFQKLAISNEKSIDKLTDK